MVALNCIRSKFVWSFIIHNGCRRWSPVWNSCPQQCCSTYYHQHWLHCLGTITWSTHNNGCTDAKKPFSSKFSFQSPAWDNLTRFIHLFQSTLFNIHKCILTFEAISTLPIQSHVLVARSQEVPEDSFCFENISIWLSVFSIRCITLPNHLVTHTATLHQSFALWFILLWSPIVWRK